MAKGDLTIMLIPSESEQAWSLHVPRALLLAGLAAVAFFVFILISGAAVTLGAAGKDLQCSLLARENRLLKERLRGMEGTVDELIKSVEQTADIERRARVLANLDDMGDDFRRMGTGGPVFAGNDPLAEHDLRVAALALDLEGRLKELEGQCGSQQESFAEILQCLEEQKDRWAHTPSIEPVTNGWPSSGFGERPDPFTDIPTMHEGMDFSAPIGTPVRATAAGVVISADWHMEFGRTVEIDHGDGIVTRYAHNDRLLVKRGQKVARGQIIATVGRSGRATAPHVHYEVRLNGGSVNPWRYIINADVVVD